jgi:cytoskeletal protein RodZ
LSLKARGTQQTAVCTGRAADSTEEREVNSKTSDQTPDGGGADGSLGQELRRAREARGVSLREISEQTRITMRHLEAIEADDYKHLPGGIFNRSFVKAYARHIHFDEQRALDLYARTAREHGDSPDEPPPTSPQRSRVYMGETQRSPLVTAGLSAIMVGVLVLVVYAGLHYIQRAREQAAGAEPTPAPAAAPPQGAQEQAPTPATAAEGFRVRVSSKRQFWLTSWQDTEKKRGRFLKPEAPEEFTPEGSLNLLFDKGSSDALEVTVNGQPLKAPASDAREITWTITKDNYKQYQ